MRTSILLGIFYLGCSAAPITGRIVHDPSECAPDTADTMLLWENLKAKDNCACEPVSPLTGAPACLPAGKPFIDTTGNAYWCSDSPACERHVGNVECAPGTIKRLWVHGYEDARACGCTFDCQAQVIGDFTVGEVTTTCCKGLDF